MRNVSGWIANSKLIEDDLKKYNIDEVNIHKIYNGINIKNIRINKFRKEKTFVVVGRLEEEKCCEQIINIFSKIPENFNAKLIFLGDGSQQKYLESLTDKLNQTHRIIFKGASDNVKNT